MSLLQDARVTVPEELETELFAYYLRRGRSARAGSRPSGVCDGLCRFRAPSNTRLLGLWLRLLKRDGKPHYVQNIPRTWGYLERNLRAPELGPLAAWYDRHFPVDLRSGRLPG